MTVRPFVLAALATLAVTGSAAAEGLTVTPTLYREQACATASVRPASELTTIPQLVPAAPTGPRVFAEVQAR